MDPNERKGWIEIVTPDDLDSHMAEIGQAEANAYLVVKMLNDFSLGQGAKLLVPGCGTGQMFDYITPDQIGKYNFTFTDLNPKFLEKLKTRLSKLEIEYFALEDDIEITKLSGHYNGILTVLLLQHVEWKKAIATMLRFMPSKLYFIIQEQEGGGHAVTKERDLTSSMREFAGIANPILVPRRELIDYLAERNYLLLKTYEKNVPDNKVMVGLVFEERS